MNAAGTCRLKAARLRERGRGWGHDGLVGMPPAGYAPGLTTMTVHTNGEVLPSAHPPGVMVERMRVFAIAAHAVEDRGHP